MRSCVIAQGSLCVPVCQSNSEEYNIESIGPWCDNFLFLCLAFYLTEMGQECGWIKRATVSEELLKAIFASNLQEINFVSFFWHCHPISCLICLSSKREKHFWKKIMYQSLKQFAKQWKAIPHWGSWRVHLSFQRLLNCFSAPFPLGSRKFQP